ncbi:hypothetical protein PG993_003517 [Apiospora rasikravindrae]|uniref:tRNA (guanine(26)-N(2))-dimethyltransferase n=1 Tax=Apiospora rasikravindrae TaxID=990691 RepID=A0ABR1U096_9PEZI
MASKKSEAASAAIDKTRVVHDGQEYTEVKEGLGRILIPVSANAATTEKDVQAEEDRQKVFYNPIQQFNRDLTVLAIKAYGEEIAARRRKTAENKLNKRKRKRADNEETGPQKQDKPAQDVPMDGSAATGAPEATAAVAPGDPMDTSEPQNDPVAATDQVGAEESGIAKETGGDAAGETVSATNGDSKVGGEARQRKPDPPRFTILDALSATGLRALRYIQELPFVTSVTANDLTASAVEAIRRNAEHNGIADKVNATQSDARAHMYSLIAQEVTQEHARNPHLARRGAPAPSKKYDVIDLDPYGTAATFFDAAVNAVRDDGGLLCVTCTDSGVWASHGYSEKAFALYGGIPVKGFHSHEAGLRLILNGLAQTAAKQGMAIEPLLSLSIDYYLRIFVRIKKSPASVKFLAGKTMIVYSCDQGCGSWETQMLLRNKKASNNKGNSFFYKHGLSMGPTADSHCAHCGSKTHLSGPMYGGPLHNREFIQRILDDLPNVDKNIYGTTARIEGMLQTALEEYLPPPRILTPQLKMTSSRQSNHTPSTSTQPPWLERSTVFVLMRRASAAPYVV